MKGTNGSISAFKKGKREALRLAADVFGWRTNPTYLSKIYWKKKTGVGRARYQSIPRKEAREVSKSMVVLGRMV